jgi:hypothetical protein
VRPRIRRELAIFAAVFAGLFVYTALEILYVLTLGGLFFLTGVPTPGGAPLAIHLMNTAIKGGWAALAYVGVMRMFFGPIRWPRVAVLWATGLVIIGAFASLAMQGTIAAPSAGNAVLVAYVVIGQIIARDWVAR